MFQQIFPTYRCLIWSVLSGKQLKQLQLLTILDGRVYSSQGLFTIHHGDKWVCVTLMKAIYFLHQYKTYWVYAFCAYLKLNLLIKVTKMKVKNVLDGHVYYISQRRIICVTDFLNLALMAINMRNSPIAQHMQLKCLFLLLTT